MNILHENDYNMIFLIAIDIEYSAIINLEIIFIKQNKILWTFMRFTITMEFMYISSLTYLWRWFFKFKNFLKCRGEFVKEGCNKFSFKLGDFVKQIMTRFISTLLSEVIHVQPCSYFHEISPCTATSNFYIWLYLFRLPTIKEI